MTGNGTHAVSLSVSGMPEIIRTVTVSGGHNVKLDYTPAYAPPVISGSTAAFLNWDNPYVFSPVGGATDYDWRVVGRTNWTAAEGAENGADPMIVAASPGYSVVNSTVKRSGTAAYHLAHPSPPVDQTLTLKTPIRLGTTSVLMFHSRLGFASDVQIARAQVSTDNGLSWRDVWTQAGTGAAGEFAFHQQTVSLAAFAAQIIRLRFAYTISPGTFYPQTTDSVGFFLDDVLVTESEWLGEETVKPVGSGTQFSYHPTQTGNYLLQVRGRTARRFFNWGPALSISVQAFSPSSPVVRLTRITRLAEGRMELRWRLESGAAAGYQLWSATDPAGPWTRMAVTVEPTGIPAEFRAPIVPAGPAHFYRVGLTLP